MNYKCQLALFLFFIGSMTAVNAQIVTKKNADDKAVRLFDRGMKYVFNKLDDKALADFNKVIDIEPTFIDAHIQLGSIHYSRKNWAKAEKKFEEVIELSSDYEPKVYYTAAMAELEQGKSEEAINHLEQYLSKNASYTKLNAKAEKFLSQFKFKAKAMANPVPFDPKPLGSGVNGPDLEYLPSLTADGETMVFTRRILPPSGNVNLGNEDFFISHLKDGVWTEGRALETINSPNTNEGAQSLSADGKLLIFTICDKRGGRGSCDLYFSQLRKGIWSAPRNLGVGVNTRAWESQPSISADKKALYFSSTRGGGQGAADIWVSYRNNKGEFEDPINLSDKINTSGDEQSPFIHPDGKTLYFMSNGHPGMGSKDLYYARILDDGTWGEPINLGYPINTEGNEGSLVVSTDGKTAYFASDRYQENGNNNKIDIYSFELYEEARPQPVSYLKAIVIDAVTKKEIKALVDLSNLNSSKRYYYARTDEKGSFLVALPTGSTYGLNVSKDGYLFHSENFALEDVSSINEPFKMTIELQPIPDEALVSDSNTETKTEVPPKMKPIILKNVFFESASAELKSESTLELNRLKKLMEENPNIKIQINGHTDAVGSDADNQTLSELRAMAVHDFLIDAGISAERLRFIGYGESKPIDSNDTDEGRQNNRRTEFLIF